ncbi:LysR family transcriptional regulator [Pseudomonas benzenivorans]|uniref:LysR family transcriptional regulator n=1 Tax=Pseudomonas benzenivorans TaxID=556533 RepID=A0ABY5H842_9PSED|nr:LysR family transcriptional regulator [Pseudomonas benzenivorans]UTW08017.1 LysR family transcriptional regulator [Pseudomonas benzenivorans]
MSSLQDHRIRYFFEAVRLGSVRAAADFLDVAPSAVSRQISQLEHELATSLLERHRRGVRPTESGERVLAYYRQRLAQQELLMDSLQSLRGLHSGSITLAAGEGFIEDLVVPLTSFSLAYPKIELKVNVCGSNEVIRQVVEDEAHIGLVFNPASDPKIRSLAHHPQPVCAIVNPEHPLAIHQASVSLADLDQYRLALPEVSYGIRQIVTQAEHQQGISLAPTLTCNTIAMLRRYALLGGVALLPTFVVADDIRCKELVALSLQNAVFASTQTHLITRLGRQLSIGANRLLNQMLAEMTAFQPH